MGLCDLGSTDVVGPLLRNVVRSRESRSREVTDSRPPAVRPLASPGVREASGLCTCGAVGCGAAGEEGAEGEADLCASPVADRLPSIRCWNEFLRELLSADGLAALLSARGCADWGVAAVSPDRTVFVAGPDGLTGAVAALDGSDVRAVSAGVCAGRGVVSRRCVDMRSSNDRRAPALPSAALGAEACGAGLVMLSVPGRLPRLPVPLGLGGSTRRGCDNSREVSRRGLEDGGVLGVGALMEGREELEGTLGADGLGLGVEGLDLFSMRLERDSRLGVPDIEGELGRGAGWAPIDGLGRLTAGGLLRKTGDDGRLLGICGLGADRKERDSLGADIRPGDEPPGLPRFENDGDGAADRPGDGAGAEARGADIRAPWPPRDEDPAWTEDPLSRTSPATILTAAARELLLFSRATDILHLLLLPGGVLSKPGTHRQHSARPYRSRTTTFRGKIEPLLLNLRATRV